MKAISSLLLMLTLSMAHAGSIVLTGNNASEANGNGWALLIPDLDATSPGVYDPVEVAPRNPFNIGTITWNDNNVAASGPATLAMTNAMCAFNFDVYVQEVISQLAVIGTGGNNITLSNITGPGLTFESRVLKSIDFTADVSWVPTLNGFPASQPYLGTVTFVNGRFTWNMSSNEASWFIGATGVNFEFDLTGTVNGMDAAPTVLPHLTWQRTSNPTQMLLKIIFPEATAASYRLESTQSLTGDWAPEGNAFNSTTVPTNLTVNTVGVSRRFYRVKREF